ncbi:MAG TPA: glycosyltransferase family 39 protein, partial [Terriglobales bacterium]
MIPINTQQEVTLLERTGQDRRASGRLAWLLSFEFFQRTLLGLTAIIALFFFVEAARLLPVHSENMTAESSTVLIAQRWAQGSPLYTDFRKPPFLIAPFPPGLYAIMAMGYKTGIRSVQGLMLFGRWLSLISLLGIGGITYLWNRDRGFSRETALVTPLLFFSFPALLPWAATVRQDFPALLFAACAVLLAFHSQAGKWIAAAAVSAAAAFLIKHSLIALPTALVLWMALNRRWKHALLFCGIWFFIVG